MSDLFGNHIVGFPMRRLKCVSMSEVNQHGQGICTIHFLIYFFLKAALVFELLDGKTNNVVTEQVRH